MSRETFFIPPVFNTNHAIGTGELVGRLRVAGAAAGTDDERELMMAQADALETIEALSQLCPPPEMRKRAALIIRCEDCDGRAVAWVTWIQGRPLFVGEYGKDAVMVSLLDVELFAAPWFRCRKRSWRLRAVEDLPGPGAPGVSRRVHHGVSAMR
jgi:hypothetical protein